MADCELITSARALYNLDNASLSSSEETTLQELIKAVSVAIERYTGRRFCSTQHDELCNGNGQLRLILKHFPILGVERVAYAPTTVFKVTNTSSSNQRATVAVTASGLSLTRVASGASSTETVSFAANATLSALKTSIDALGNGWSAAIPDSDHNDRASADLRALQGALNAKEVEAPLKIHAGELSDFEVDNDHGWLLRARSIDETLAPPFGPGWGGGINYWRVIYTAGYAAIPEDVQEAAAQWVAALYWQTKRDPALSQEHIPSAFLRSPIHGMTETVQLLLAPYRSRRILNFGG